MNVRIYILALALAMSALAGCNQSKLEQLEKENQELKEVASRQDSVLNDFLSAFSQVEENLAIIRERENIVSVSSGDPELQGSSRERVIEDIQLINELLAQNREIIDNLNGKLQNSSLQLTEFRKMVDKLNQQLVEKDREIGELKEELVAMNYEVEALNTRVNTLSARSDSLMTETQSQAARLAEQEEQIETQVEELNTAYYAVGNFRDLRDQNVVVKEGGLIGMGRTAKMADDFNTDAFTRIDVREITRIPLGAKKVEVVSTHPSDSYVLNEVDKVVESLEIIDAEKFWGSTKYLVVLLD